MIFFRTVETRHALSLQIQNGMLFNFLTLSGESCIRDFLCGKLCKFVFDDREVIFTEDMVVSVKDKVTINFREEKHEHFNFRTQWQRQRNPGHTD